VSDNSGWVPWQKRSPENRETFKKQARERHKARRADPEYRQQERERDKAYRATSEYKDRQREFDKKRRGYSYLRKWGLLHHAPPWLTKEQWVEMEAFHVEKDRLTKETSVRYSVDHVYPFFGRNKYNQWISSGLHVPWNLQVITFEENDKKHWWNPPGSGFDEPCTPDQLEILRLFELERKNK
jgi:hypothetical protein